jgi:hypothetical protein
MSEEPAKAPELPSDDFMDAVRDGSTLVSTCELCGRECFEDNEHAGDWEPSELETLRKGAKEQPDKYIPMGRVEIGNIAGKHVVVNCPCGKLKSYEDFFWSHRHMIARYISARAKARAEEAVSDEQEAEELQDDVDREGSPGEQAELCNRCGGYFPASDLKWHGDDSEMCCPTCYEKVRCEGCGKLFDKRDLDDGKCLDCVTVAMLAKQQHPGWTKTNDEEDNLPF